MDIAVGSMAFVKTEEIEKKSIFQRNRGYSEVTFTSDHHMGMWIADAFLWETKADAAVVPDQAVENRIREGTVTADEMEQLLDQEQTMELLLIRGTYIKRALETTVDASEQYALAGVSYEIWEQEDHTMEIRNVRIGGKPLEEKRWYRLAGRRKDLFQTYSCLWEDATVLDGEQLPKASEMMKSYLFEEENGMIQKEKYGSIRREIVIPWGVKTTVTIEEDGKELYEGQIYQMNAIVDTPSGEIGVNWKTSDSRIAAISKNGKIAGIRPGKVTIVAEAKDGSGVKAVTKIRVKPINGWK